MFAKTLLPALAAVTGLASGTLSAPLPSSLWPLLKTDTAR